MLIQGPERRMHKKGVMDGWMQEGGQIWVFWLLQNSEQPAKQAADQFTYYHVSLTGFVLTDSGGEKEGGEVGGTGK